MLKVHEDGNLTNRCRWNAVIFVINASLFDGVLFACLHVNAFVDTAIGSTAEFALILVLIQNIVWHLNSCRR